ncbi:MAG: AAA family ATPase [bacterium]
MEQEEVQEEINSLEIRGQKHKENLRIIRERKAEFVDPKDIPIELLRAERENEKIIQETEKRLKELKEENSKEENEDNNKLETAFSFLKKKLLSKINIPIIAFHGFHGGSGTTTIMEHFADLISQGKEKHNILMIDLDVFIRGLTENKMSRCIVAEPCKTIHEYMSKQKTELQSAVDVTNKKLKEKSGRVFLIPSAISEDAGVFTTMKSIQQDKILKIICSLVTSAIDKYGISCVLLDCASAINPYTSTGIYISNIVFIIREVEVVVQNRTQQIREFYPDFIPQNVKVILNKSENTKNVSAFANIPLIIDLINKRGSSPSIFDKHIYNIIEKTFEEHYSNLVPDWISVSKRFPELRSDNLFENLFPVAISPFTVSLNLFSMAPIIFFLMTQKLRKMILLLFRNQEV